MVNLESNESLRVRVRAVKPKRLTVLSAFTGIGGLDLGLELAGFETIACVERDKTARKTLRANRPNWHLIEPGDIESAASLLTPRLLGLRLGDLSLLAGGSPCQPFSKAAQWSANSRGGLADPRSLCLNPFLTLLENFLPKVFLIENVYGFITGRISVLPKVERSLARIREKHGVQYRLESRLLNAVHYGVPQRRQRAFVIAIRDGGAFQWPIPTHLLRPVRAWDALAGLRDSETPHQTGRWADLLSSIPEGKNYIWHTDRGGGHPLFGYRTRYWSFLLKLSRQEPSWTISAQPGPGTGPFHWDNRPLSVKELLRIQSFPMDWQISGNYREQVKQIGNATPPLLAEVIGRAIGRQVFGLTYNVRPKLLISRRRIVPRPSKTREVPDKYRALEAKHAQHPGKGKGPKPIVRNGVV
jgi:DNA (cytosine-5)-methyltransferase 1